MAVVATGAIADRPFGRTVALVAQRRFTGRLAFGPAGIDWADGQVVGAAGTHPGDGAIKTAMGAGLLTSTQASDILRKVKPGDDDVAAVAEYGKLAPEQAAKLRRRVVANRAMRLFALTEGDFALDDTPPETGVIVPIDVRLIIHQGVRAHYPEERMLQEMALMGDSFRLRADLSADQVSAAFGFGHTEVPVVDAMTEMRTPTALVQAVPDIEGRTTLSVLYALVVVGYAEPGSQRRARATAQTSPPPAVGKPTTIPPPIKRTTIPPPTKPGTIPPPVVAAGSGPGSDAIRALVVERTAALKRKADHFELLGVTAEAPPDQIRRAYFELARQLHPDRITALGLDDIRGDAQRLFAEINAAFGVLSHPKRRQDYAQVLAAGGAEVVREKQDEAESVAMRVLDAETAYRTGEMAMRRNHFTEALAAFKRAVELNPEEGEHHALYAWASWVAATDKAAAAKLARAGLEKAVQLSPNSPLPHLYLGRLLRSSGDDAGAAVHFRKALDIAPGHADASSELRVLEARNPKLRH